MFFIKIYMLKISITGEIFTDNTLQYGLYGLRYSKICVIFKIDRNIFHGDREIMPLCLMKHMIGLNL